MSIRLQTTKKRNIFQPYARATCSLIIVIVAPAAAQFCVGWAESIFWNIADTFNVSFIIGKQNYFNAAESEMRTSDAGRKKKT